MFLSVLNKSINASSSTLAVSFEAEREELFERTYTDWRNCILPILARIFQPMALTRTEKILTCRSYLYLKITARFQSEVIELMSVFAGHKRPLIEVDNATFPHAIVLKSERIDRVSSIAEMVRLSRVFKHQYQHDCTLDDSDNSAECDGYSDVASSKSSVFGEFVNIADPEVRCQMIEDPHSDNWNYMAPEAAQIMDKVKCTHKDDKTDPNNFIYMAHFFHCFFDGLNLKPPTFPTMKIHYVGHDPETVWCSMIGTDGTVGLEPRYRVVVHIIFYTANLRKFAMVFLREGGRDINPVTYELEFYFKDANKAAAFLNWKEEQTERAMRAGSSAAEIAFDEDIGQE